MKLISIRDFRNSTAQLREELEAEGELVVTVNGRPFAVMTRVSPESLEDDLRMLRLARARAAVSRIRERSRTEGLDRMSMEEIDALVARVRSQRQPAESDRLDQA
jgi:antitoxin (DNA-binding transcriptional repressor) of toxin-antitoxin stability system